MRCSLRYASVPTGTARIRAIDLYVLSNAGAYGDHGPTTIGLAGHKSIPLYGGLRASRFSCDVVYTNTMGAGAYRGYGATQGIFAVESAVNELAAELGIDPSVIREKNMVREGQIMPAYYGELCGQLYPGPLPGPGQGDDRLGREVSPPGAAQRTHPQLWVWRWRCREAVSPAWTLAAWRSV